MRLRLSFAEYLTRSIHILLGWSGPYIYMVYIRRFWQGNHQINSHIHCICTVMANPTHRAHTHECSPYNSTTCTEHLHRTLAHTAMLTLTHTLTHLRTQDKQCFRVDKDQCFPEDHRFYEAVNNGEACFASPFASFPLYCLFVCLFACLSLYALRPPLPLFLCVASVCAS